MKTAEEQVEIDSKKALVLLKIATLIVAPLTFIVVYFKRYIIAFINQNFNINFGGYELAAVYLFICLIIIKVSLSK